MCLLGVTHFQHLDNWSLEHISHLQALPWLFFNQSALVKKKSLIHSANALCNTLLNIFGFSFIVHCILFLG